MSTSTVRAAIQAYLSTPQIAGVERVYLEMPTFIAGNQWRLSQNAGWGSVAWTHISDESESRLTMPVGVGQKRVEYKVGLVVVYQYLIPPQPPAGSAEDVWVTHLDDTIGAIKARVRADPTFGTGPQGVVWQAGQQDGDLHLQRDMPVMLPGKVLVWNVLEFTVTEMVTA